MGNKKQNYSSRSLNLFKGATMEAIVIIVFQQINKVAVVSRYFTKIIWRSDLDSEIS